METLQRRRLHAGGFDVLGLEAYAYESCGELLEAGDGGEELEEEWGLYGAGVAEDSVEDFVGEDLYALGVVDGALAVVLDAGEVVGCSGSGEEGFGEDVGGGYGVLQRDVDADAADGGHGVGGVSDAEQAGRGPLLEAVDFYGEELDFVPGVEGGGAAGEEGDDALDALLEGVEAGGLDGGEGAFGYDVADLVVVVAIDEDDEAAVVDVAEAVLGVAGLAGEAEPEDVDGDAVVDEREVGGDAGDGVAAVAADGEVRGDGRRGRWGCWPGRRW